MSMLATGKKGENGLRVRGVLCIGQVRYVCGKKDS